MRHMYVCVRVKACGPRVMLVGESGRVRSPVEMGEGTWGKGQGAVERQGNVLHR